MVARKPSFVRFVCFLRVGSQKQRLGRFQAIDEARQSDNSESWALGEINELNAWFSSALNVPDRFERGRWRRPSQLGLSWFKVKAHEHVRQMHRLKSALEACGVHVEMLTTSDPGTIIYEDDHQIVAEPGGRGF
jgi:hypothetical protein